MSPAPAHRKIAAIAITALLTGAPRAVTLEGSCNRIREPVPLVILAEKDPWRCVEIPGFLIYSRPPDAYCQRFADELRQHNLQLAILGSEAEDFQTLSNQIPIVLRVSDSPGSTLSARSVQVYDDEIWLIDVVELPQLVPDIAATPASSPGAFVTASDPIGPPTPAEYLARDAFWRRLAYTRPIGPQWLRHGLEHLMNETRSTPAGLQLGRPATRPNMPDVSIEDIIAASYSDLDPYRHEALTRQAALFLRWAMVTDVERRGILWEFAGRHAQQPTRDPEDLLLETFGMTYGQVGVELSDSQLHRARVAGRGNKSQLQLSEVRFANEEEVARLVSTITGLNERAMTHNRQMAAAQ